MKGLKKLALASAIIAASSSAFAMQAMDDEALSAATGQDGITLSITTPALGITMATIIHDNDGHTGNANSGAIVIGDPADPLNATAGGNRPMSIVFGGALNLVIDADGGDATPVAAGQTGAYLNIGVSLTGTTTIHTGDLSVMNSGTTSGTQAAGAGYGTVTAAGTPLLNDMTITLGATTANIQLGSEPQGAMIRLNTVMTGGLNIANFSLNDANSGGSIAVASIGMRDAGVGATDLTVDASVNATAAGLAVSLNQLGDATNGVYQTLTGVKLGAPAAAVLGDIEVIGLNLNGTAITISGH